MPRLHGLQRIHSQRLVLNVDRLLPLNTEDSAGPTRAGTLFRRGRFTNRGHCPMGRFAQCVCGTECSRVGCRFLRRCVTPFLKEFVKPKRFPVGSLHTGNAVRNRLFSVSCSSCRGFVTFF